MFDVRWSERRALTTRSIILDTRERLYCGILRCTGQNNQLTAINAHVGYVLFIVVMTTFTVAPSSGVPYADALFVEGITVSP